MNNIGNEPNLNDIEDYNNKESNQKRNTVRLVIIFCLVIGAFVAYIKSTSVPNDYVGTEDKPGISTSKK